GKFVKLQRLHEFLIEHTRAGGNAAILIDEAQDLDARVLEELRLLSNLETGTEKILQILLAGQPELERKLAQAELRQLRQRIALHVRLCAFTPAEVAGYIRARLQRAGAADGALFTPEALARIAEVTEGIPRVVNLLCDAALITGLAEGARQISRAIIDATWADYAHLSPAPVTASPSAPAPPPAGPTPPPRPQVGTGGAAGAAGGRRAHPRPGGGSARRRAPATGRFVVTSAGPARRGLAPGGGRQPRGGIGPLGHGAAAARPRALKPPPVLTVELPGQTWCFFSDVRPSDAIRAGRADRPADRHRASFRRPGGRPGRQQARARRRVPHRSGRAPEGAGPVRRHDRARMG